MGDLSFNSREKATSIFRKHLTSVDEHDYQTLNPYNDTHGTVNENLLDRTLTGQLTTRLKNLLELNIKLVEPNYSTRGMGIRINRGSPIQTIASPESSYFDDTTRLNFENTFDDDYNDDDDDDYNADDYNDDDDNDDDNDDDYNADDDPDNFDDILARPKQEQDEIRAENMRRLRINSIILVLQARKYLGLSPEIMEYPFNMTPNQIFRYVKNTDPILKLMTPTPRWFMSLMRRIDNQDDFDKMFPGRIYIVMIDNSHIRFCKPFGPNTLEKLTKQNTTVGNTALLVNSQEYIIAMSNTIENGHVNPANDLEYFLPDLGKFSKKMIKDAILVDKKTSMKFLQNRGFLFTRQGFSNYDQTSTVKMIKKTDLPHFIKKPLRQNKYRKKIDAITQHPIKINTDALCRITNAVYEGNMSDFNDEYNITCGLDNYSMLYPIRSFEYWMKVFLKQQDIYEQ